MNLIKEMTHEDGRLRACWLGNDGWLFSHGGHLIATDLDFFLEERKLPPMNEIEELAARLEFLFITHAHTDHCNPQTLQELMRMGDCRVVLARSCRAALRFSRLYKDRLSFVEPGRTPLDDTNNPLPMARVGGTVPGLPGWLQVEAVRALHGHRNGAVYAGAHRWDCGFLMHFGGKQIFQPGDSVLLQEHMELQGLDVLLVSPTEHNMGVSAARNWIEAVRPAHALAQHFETYRENADNHFWTHGYQRELQEALGEEMRQRYRIPEYGTPFVLE